MKSQHKIEMISHKYKCIFIHIAKCAGTSIEHAFGIDVNNHFAEENDFLYGWDKSNKLWLQHATPQQLLDKNLISAEQWNSYYKFIVYRNSWDRAYSDYNWMKEVRNVHDTFINFLNREGNYKRILNDDSTNFYAGDHLYLQKDYFFLNNERIRFDTEIDFYDLNDGLNIVIRDLKLEESFFKQKLNISKRKKKRHYSFFFNEERKRLVARKYKQDILFFNFHFDERKNLLRKVILNFIK